MRGLAAVTAAAFVALMAWSSSAGAVDVEIYGYPFGCKTADGETRKPKFGDVGSIYFTGLPAARKACLETIDRMIYSCGANTTFISHDLNNQYADCLPIFEQQAKWCARHFELQRSKCDAGGTSAPSESSEAAADPAVEPADLTMWAFKRSNLRSGPGTDHAKVGLLEVGDEVQVTGEIGDWLRIAAPGGGEAFVYAPLLTEEAPARPLAATEAPGRLCSHDAKDSDCWQELTERPGCHLWVHDFDPGSDVTVTWWTGFCDDGIADGGGALLYGSRSNASYFGEQATTISQGKIHGNVLGRSSTGYFWEGQYVEGRPHGRSITHGPGGTCVHVIDWSDGEVSHFDEECKEYLASNSADSRAQVEATQDEFATSTPAAEAAADTAAVLDPKCAGMAEGSQCWMEFAERPGCYAWTNYWSQDKVITSWTGRCEDGMADGDGMLSTSGGLEAPATLVAGKATNVGSFDYVEGPPDQEHYSSEQLAADTTENKGRSGIEVEETTMSGSSAESGTESAVSDTAAAGAPRIPVDATHCVKLHETGGKYTELCVDQYGAEADCDGNNRWYFRYEIIDRSFENACNRPIVLRVRHFAKFGSDDHRSYVNDFMSPGNYRPDYYSYGNVLLINNTDRTDRVMSTAHPPPTEIAYCAEFVDTDITPEYLYSDRYRLNEGGEFGSYSGVVDHLRHQGINVGPEMKAYHDAYISSLAHSPCYADVIREPPVDYEHFPPLDWYEISRMSTFVTYHKRNGGFEALSFDEEADFGGVSFHDVGGTDTHYISDLPKPVGRN